LDGNQRRPKSEMQGEFVLDAFHGIRQRREEFESCAEMRDGFRIGRPFKGLLSRGVPIVDRLGMEPSRRIVLREERGLGGHGLRKAGR
jgi:hypothetical protein